MVNVVRKNLLVFLCNYTAEVLTPQLTSMRCTIIFLLYCTELCTTFRMNKKMVGL